MNEGVSGPAPDRIAVELRRQNGLIRGDPGPLRRDAMRIWRTSMAAACLLAAAPGVSSAQSGPTARNLLELQPILKGVEYEIPADAAAIDACKTETVFNAQKKAIGVALRDGQGKLLRRFIDSDGNNK